MKERVLIVLFATLCLGGCLKILGDYDLNGTDPPKPGSTPTDLVPCWFRPGDGLCACQPSPPTPEYDDASVTTCERASSGGKCCGYDGWPQSGDCLCAVARCLEITGQQDSCVCGFYAVTAPDSGFTESDYCSGTNGPCCARPGVCHCNGDQCDLDAGEGEVMSCSPSDFASSVPCGGDAGKALDYCRR